MKCTGQKVITTHWVITEKVKDGERKCKDRFVARGFEERDGQMTTDSPTCVPESLKTCLALIMSHSLLWRHIVLLTVGVFSSNHRVLYTIGISMTRRFKKM